MKFSQQLLKKIEELRLSLIPQVSCSKINDYGAKGCEYWCEGACDGACKGFCGAQCGGGCENGLWGD